MGGRHGRTRSPNGIGEQIFAEVEKLTADGKMKRLTAFKETLAQEIEGLRKDTHRFEKLRRLLRA